MTTNMTENNENIEMDPELQNPETDETNQANASTESNQPEETPAEPTADELLEKANEQIADLKDKNLRMMAEFDNYRRRTSKEKLDLIKSAGENIFLDMLPLIDDFERAKDAMAKTEDIESLRQGIDLIYNKFISFLQKNEVEAIDAKDQTFDTEYHEAITTFPAPTEEQKGKVIDCTQKGYTLAGKVIRYAKVVVGE